MNKKLIGLLAGTTLAIAGVAFAQSDVSRGGSSMGTSSDTMGSAQQSQNEITGQVIQKKGSTVFVQDHMGAVVPLKTDKSTKYEGFKGNALKEVKEGDQIRASFDVRRKTENLATLISLEPAQGTGGSSDIGKKEGSPSEEKGETPMQEQQEQEMERPSGSQSNQPSKY